MSADKAVEVKGLTVRFGDFIAVDDIGFEVSKGEIFGFLGANGAGKTTTIRVLCGLITPSAGAVRVAGLDFGSDAAAVAIKSKVGYMSQKLTIYQDMSVEENLEFCANLRKMEPARMKARVKELFDFIQFDTDPKTMVKDLPGGLKQEVSLAVSMLHDPEIVFLDEPTSGVAPAARQRFWQLIRRVADSGKTVFVTTHYMTEAEQCGRIALMRDGKIIALDTPAGLKRTAFPVSLIELSSDKPLSKELLAQLKNDPAMRSLVPYGMRWHLEPAQPGSMESLRHRLPAEVELAEVAPSLEDVFIRMVEGKR
ncbi:MAG: ABC transporter ATP-binding protein [candidate division FCPU426 bacterium]